MARIRLPIAVLHAGIGAAAPTFVEVPGSYLPVVSGKVDAHGVLPGVLLGDPALADVTVQVDVPDEDVTGGKLDVVKISARYPNHYLLKSGAIK